MPVWQLQVLSISIADAADHVTFYTVLYLLCFSARFHNEDFNRKYMNILLFPHFQSYVQVNCWALTK